MRLKDVAVEYCLQREVSNDYSYQLNYAVQRFIAYAGNIESREVSERLINAWLMHEKELGKIGDRSRRNCRASLLTLLRFVEADLRYDRVRRVKVAPQAPQAWLPEQLAAIAKACKALPGIMDNGLKRSDYFATCVWFAFETGLRRSDVWRFDMRWLDESNQAALVQHKVQKVHTVRITDETRCDLELLRAKLASGGYTYSNTPLHWPHHWSVFYYWLAKARASVGIDPETNNRALQHIRRTGATAVECVERDAGSRYLGHSSGPGLARKSYIDPRMVSRTLMPPTVRPNGRANQTDQGTGRSDR